MPIVFLVYTKNLLDDIHTLPQQNLLIKISKLLCVNKPMRKMEKYIQLNANCFPWFIFCFKKYLLTKNKMPLYFTEAK